MRLVHYLGMKPQARYGEKFYPQKYPDLPKFQIGGGEGEINFVDDFYFPEKITILAQVEPVLISYQPKINAKQNLYEMSAALQSYGRMQYIKFKLIDVKDHQTSKSIGEKFLSFKRNDYFFSKKFNTQISDLQAEHNLGIIRLFAYGGYYHSGCALDQIEQLFFNIALNNQIHVTRASLWLSKGINPPCHAQLARELVEFHDKDLHTSLSLMAAIQNGELIFNLFGIEDEKGAIRRCSYISFSINKTANDTDVVEILLTKK